MERRTLPAIVLGILALGVAGLTWWLLEPGGSRDQAAPAVGAQAARATQRSQDVARVDQVAQPPDPAGTEPVREQRSAVERPDAPPPRPTLELRVVHGQPAQPVAGAEVLFALGPADEDSPPTIHGWVREGLVEARIEAIAIRARTDEEGQARVPGPERSAIVVARRGNLWGYRSLEPTTEGPLELRLHEDHDIEVLVVDPSGRRLADRPVSLRSRQSTWQQDLLLARTDADGRAVLRHAGHRMRTGSQGSGVTWSAALLAALEDPVEQTLDPSAPPTQPIRLVAPATGSLEVLVLDRRGVPYTGPVTAGLRLLGRDSAPAQAWMSPPTRDLVLPESRGGRVLFEHVEPGRSFEVTVSRRGGSVQHSAEGPGPAAPGERARLEVHIGRTSAVLLGRVLDPEGLPLAGIKLRSRTDTEGELGAEQRSFEIPTDDQGRFEIDHPLQAEPLGRTSLTVFVPGPAGEERLSATRVLPQDLRPGPHDLGDIVLEVPPLLASGVVLDEGGEPVQGLWVTPALKKSWSRDRPEDFHWDETMSHRVRSDEKGAFELRAHVAAQPLRLSARGRGLRGDPVETVVGASGIVLRVTGTGAIEGSVLLDPGIKPSVLSVRAEVQDPPRGEASVWASPTRLAEDGSFRIEDLRPGTYTLSLQASSGRSSLPTFRDVAVRAGGVTRDARFDPLDLRGTLRALTIEVVDPKERPVPQGQITYRTSSEEEGRRNQMWFHGGSVTLFPSSLPIDVTISVEGFADVMLAAVDSDRRVVLEQGPQLRLLLRGILPPEPPYHLSVVLTPVRDGDQAPSHRWPSDAATFDSRGEANVRSPAAGPVSVSFMLSIRRGNSATGTVFRSDPPQVLEVADHAGPQIFEVQVDPETYQTTRQGLREPR